MAELEELEQEELDKNLLDIEGTENVPLPNVPSTSLPARPGILCYYVSCMEYLLSWQDPPYSDWLPLSFNGLSQL